MPVGAGRYRMKNGVRLHFTPSGRVNEAKNMKTGATHTPAEFEKDRRETASTGRSQPKRCCTSWTPW